MVILTAEQEVDQQNGDGRAGDDHYAIAEEQKAEHVIDFVEPDAVHDEVELDKNGTEGKNANKK